MSNLTLLIKGNPLLLKGLPFLFWKMIMLIAIFGLGGLLFISFYIFCRLREAIQKQHMAELQKAYQSLEVKVQERTADLANANKLLEQEIAERKQAQERQEAMAIGLHEVVGLADELILCSDIDSLFKQAVELGRDRLGLERCAIFIEDGDYIQGTYGTDRYGHTTDEHAQRFPKNDLWKERFQSLHSQPSHWIMVEESRLEWDGEKTVKIDEGWIALTRIYSVSRPIGIFVNDTAISKSPLDPIKQDVLAVSCSALGNIIERKLAEKELQESESKFKGLAEKSLVGIYIIQDGVFKYINPRLAEILGYTAEELLENKKLNELAFPDDWPMIEENIRKRVSGEINSAHYSFRVITRNKGVIFVEAYGSRTEYRGRPAILGTLLDITVRKQMEDEIKARQEYLQKLTESSLDLIITIKNDGAFAYTNRRLKEMFGYEFEEIKDRHFIEFIPQEFHACVLEKWDEVQKGVSGTYETKVIKKDGSLIDCLVSHSKIEGTDEYLAVIKDITDRKRAEEERESALKNWQDTFETMSDGVWILDSECRIIKSNGRLEQLLGIKTEEILGQYCYKVFHCTPNFIGECPLKHMQQTYQREEIEFKDEERGLWFHITVDPIRDKSGQIRGAVHIMRDITERKQVEKKLEILNKELIKSNERLRELALRDSHTGLYNHRYLEEAIEAEFYRAKRSRHPLSVIMLDIDYFKSINDVYGHPFGDVVLKQLSRQLKKMVRRYDIVVRFGGEEFIIISPGTGRSTALILAQRILTATDEYRFGNGEHTVKLKLSLAVASYPEDKVTRGMDLVDVADKILNKVKEYGGNRVYSSLDMKEAKPSIKELGRESAEVKSLKKKIERLTKRTNQSLIEAVFAFAKTIEVKDRSTGEHVEKTVYYATEIARALNLSKEEIEHLKQASILHDLGKVGISEKILLKNSSLSQEEFEEIKRHPQIGADIIRPIHFLGNIIPFMLYHHERWDGKGYPTGLKEDEIPVGARILAMADVYEALVSERPYRKAYPKDEAIKIIKDGAGTQFDPQIADIFLKILQQEK